MVFFKPLISAITLITPMVASQAVYPAPAQAYTYQTPAQPGQVTTYQNPVPANQATTYQNSLQGGLLAGVRVPLQPNQVTNAQIPGQVPTGSGGLLGLGGGLSGVPVVGNLLNGLSGVGSLLTGSNTGVVPPQTQPQVQPVPRPVPVPAPVPQPQPQVQPVPRPVPVPAPVPQPQPQVQPVPKPVPQPIPQVQPVQGQTQAPPVTAAQVVSTIQFFTTKSYSIYQTAQAITLADVSSLLQGKGNIALLVSLVTDLASSIPTANSIFSRAPRFTAPADVNSIYNAYVELVNTQTNIVNSLGNKVSLLKTVSSLPGVLRQSSGFVTVIGTALNVNIIPSRATDVQKTYSTFYANFQAVIYLYTGSRTKREISQPMRFMPREMAASA